MKHLLVFLSLAAVAGVPCARPAQPAASAPAAAASGTGAAGTGAAVADAAAPGTSQRSKMKACNADARSKALHGDERRAFMKQCLSGKAKSPAAS